MEAWHDQWTPAADTEPIPTLQFDQTLGWDPALQKYHVTTRGGAKAGVVQSLVKRTECLELPMPI